MNKKEEILKSIKTGQNQKVLDWLYHSSLNKVRAYIKNNSGNHEEANDIFQDAVIIFFQKVLRNEFDQKQDIDGFIFTVAKHLWIDKIRKEKTAKKYNDSLDPDTYIDANDQLYQLMEKEKTSRMKKAFEQLDEKCREILNSSIHLRLSMKEICEQLGYKNESVAKSAHYRCKKYLAKVVKNDKELMTILKG